MSLINDISTVTTIPVLTLEKLVEKEQMCILHSVVENEKQHEYITQADIGIGIIYIKHENNELKYKFIPSKNFESNLKTTINTGESPLIYAIEEALKEKVTNIYKDLF